MNNTYAQYLTGRPVRPESLNVGGVYSGPVFTGCFGVEVSLVSLARSGAALFRQASALARSALTTGPTSPSTLVSAMGAAGGSGFPSWRPSASLAYPYEIGGEVEIPLSSLPQRWQTVFAAECAPAGN